MVATLLSKMRVPADQVVLADEAAEAAKELAEARARERAAEAAGGAADGQAGGGGARGRGDSAYADLLARVDDALEALKEG